MMIEKIKNVIGEVINNPALAQSFPADADIITDIGLDSLQMIDFMLRIEGEFDIELDFDTLEIGKLRSIQTFADYLALQKPVE